MPKVNTLFSYFSPTPKVSTPDVKHDQSRSPKEQAKQRLFNEKMPTASPKNVTRDDDIDKKDCKYRDGNVVWAKLEGFPWWPSLVCKHPTEGTFFKAKKTPSIHVQFFDDQKSRAWISMKSVCNFEGKDDQNFRRGGRFFSTLPEIQQGVDAAVIATEQSIDERLKMIVCCPSDNEEVEQEDMEIEDEMNSSNKENKDGECEEDVDEAKRSTKRPCRSAAAKRTKRRRIIVESGSEESDGDEFKPDEGSLESDNDSSGVDEDDVNESPVDSDPETPQKSRKRKRGSTPTPTIKSVKKILPETPTTQTSIKLNSPSVSLATKSKLSTFKAVDSTSSGGAPSGEDAEPRFPHQSFEWLKDGKRKDAKGVPQSNPDYDPSTIYVPKTFLEKCTPAMKQWWDMKTKYFDTIMFFKMGKFYELYHTDAEIAVKQLGLVFMKGLVAHCGFPEIAYGRYSETLIQKGYRVVRIEQTETPNDMQERCRKMCGTASKFDKVVKREACRVTTMGTRTFSFIDGDSCDAKNNYLLSIAERSSSDTSGDGTVYGVCFIDTSIGKFHIGQFQDDRHCSRLRTLIAHYTPAQVLYEKGKQQSQTQQILNNNLLSILKEALAPGSQFWSAEKTLKTLVEESYMNEEGADDGIQNLATWPETIKNMVAEGDSLGLTPKEGCELALSAFGACIWYLKKCGVEQELLSMRNCATYVPVDDTSSVNKQTNLGPCEFAKSRHNMVLDGVALANLDILENKLTGTTEGTLLGTVEQCSTPFGKRLFKQWLCAPLCNPESINNRLDAVEDIMSIPDVVAEVKEILATLPDLERLLSKVHSLGLKRNNNNHPDSRAIFFEDVAYSKRKIDDFLTTLTGFRSSMRIAKLFEKCVPKLRSTLLCKTVSFMDSQFTGHFPNLSKQLSFFTRAFDHNKAKQQGAIIPCVGVNQDYDTAMDDIAKKKKVPTATLR